MQIARGMWYDGGEADTDMAHHPSKSFRKGSLYRVSDDPRGRVPWFEISNLSQMTDRPSTGDTLLFLGKSDTFLGERYPIYGWHFLHGDRYVVAFNEEFAWGLEPLGTK